MSEWTSVPELPKGKSKDHFLCIVEKTVLWPKKKVIKTVEIRRLDYIKRFRYKYKCNTVVTHWMPLPEAPNEGENK